MTKGELFKRLENVADDTELTIIISDGIRFSLESDVFLLTEENKNITGEAGEHVICQLYPKEPRI